MKTRIFLFMLACFLLGYYYATRPKLSTTGRRDLLKTQLSLDSTFNEVRDMGNINLDSLIKELVQVPGYDVSWLEGVSQPEVTFKRPGKNFDDEDFRRLFFNRLHTDEIIEFYKKMPIKINVIGKEIDSFTVKETTKGKSRYVYLPYDILTSITRRVREQNDNIAP